MTEPIILETADSLKKALAEARKRNKSVGFVPTMGGLHDGHRALFEKCLAENDLATASIFVNPLQFGESSDFDNYPRDIEADMRILRQAGTELVFCPSEKEMYPEKSVLDFELPEFTKEMEGEFRPGHFEGVAMAVAALLKLFGKCRIYFGEKDYQQLLMISQMVKEMNIDAEVVGAATVREKDGLALSSRNVHLSPEDRKAGLLLHQTLQFGKSLIESGESSSSAVEKQMAEHINEASVGLASPVQLEYACVRRSSDLCKLETLVSEEEKEGEEEPEGSLKVRILIAARVGETRLIDNISV